MRVRGQAHLLGIGGREVCLCPPVSINCSFACALLVCLRSTARDCVQPRMKA